MKIIVSLFLVLVAFQLSAQCCQSLTGLEPKTEFDNIHVQKISEDSFQSTFVIWVKKEVKEHFHKEHSENIVVIQGKAVMTINGEKVTIKKGDFLNIPQGTKHAVIEVLSRKPLKVLSTQAPYFDGTDRTFVTD